MIPFEIPEDIDVAVTCTGGLDSVTLAYMLRDSMKSQQTLYLVHCNYGQAVAKHSWDLVCKHEKLLEDTVAIELPIKLPIYSTPVGNEGLFKHGYVPSEESPAKTDYASPLARSYKHELVEGRNAFLFLHMLAWCVDSDIPILYTGHQYQPAEWEHLDSFKHRTEDFGPGFIDRMNLLQEVGFSRRVTIAAPFLTLRWDKKRILQAAQEFGIKPGIDTYSCQFYPKCGKCDNCKAQELNS